MPTLAQSAPASASHSSSTNVGAVSTSITATSTTANTVTSEHRQTRRVIHNRAKPPSRCRKIGNFITCGGDITQALTVFLVLTALVAVWWFFDHVKVGIALCLAWIQRLGVVYGSLVLTLVIVVQALLLLPCLPFTLGAGFLYGCVMGSIVVHIASTIAALIGFVTSRYLARELLERKLATGSKDSTWRLIDRAIRDDGFRLVFLIRFSPLHPYGLCNYLFGMTSVTLKDYMLGSFLGMIPATVIEVYFGTALKSLTDLVGDENKDGNGTKTKGSGHGDDTASKYIFWGGLIVTLAVTVYMTLWVKRKLASKLVGYERVEPIVEADETTELDVETDFEGDIEHSTNGIRLAASSSMLDSSSSTAALHTSTVFDIEQTGVSAPVRKHSGASIGGGMHRSTRHGIRKSRVYSGGDDEAMDDDDDFESDGIDDPEEDHIGTDGEFGQVESSLPPNQSKALVRLMRTTLDPPKDTVTTERAALHAPVNTSTVTIPALAATTTPSGTPAQLAAPAPIKPPAVLTLPSVLSESREMDRKPTTTPPLVGLTVVSPSIGTSSGDATECVASPLGSFHSVDLSLEINDSTRVHDVRGVPQTASLAFETHMHAINEADAQFDRYKSASPFSSASLMGWLDRTPSQVWGDNETNSPFAPSQEDIASGMQVNKTAPSQSHSLAMPVTDSSVQDTKNSACGLALEDQAQDGQPLDPATLARLAASSFPAPARSEFSEGM